ncbi:hypothetical protein V6669_12040 [Paenibacillus sp. Y5S-9]|uniref:hypothetical protein n=1 Tax=Paenibacillus sp. Y5S-9 TaxID=3122489 RepID=UPI0030D05CC0
MERKYEEIREYNEEEIKEILERQVFEELILVSLSVAMYHPNWRAAQNLCLKLAEHSHPHVRANAILGLAHVARTKGELNKRIVKPVILQELKNNEEHRGTIIDAISDINHFLEWNLARKHDL